MKDIVDRIDSLVDESLARGRGSSGRILDDYSADRYDRCGHCNRAWHGLPLTEQIVAMYEIGEFDESYRVDEDDSAILCPGSDFIGPILPESLPERRGYFPPRFNTTAFQMAINRARGLYGPAPTQRRWWRTTLPSDATVTQDWDTNWVGNRVTIEIGDTGQTFDGETVRSHYERDEENTTRVFDRPIVVDVLADVAPNIGGTWEPLTAPGVTRHPD